MARIMCRSCNGYLGLEGANALACPHCRTPLVRPAPRESPAAAPESGSGEFRAGAVVCALGVAVTAGTYFASAPGGSYVVAWGAILFGGLRMLRGISPTQSPPDPPDVVELEVAPKQDG